jgi:hypothetical protein
MTDLIQFNDVLEAANNLPIDDQETLIDILNRRLHDIRRAEIIKDVKSAQKEYLRKQCTPITPDALIEEILK